jgi:hypothetical protein
MARPSIYTPELGNKICEIISTSNKSLRTICKELNISVSSVLLWLSDNQHQEFSLQYARAKEEQADFLAEEILEIADDSSNDTMTVKNNRGEDVEVENREWTNRSRLRVDARKWIASKLKPKKYGDKVDVTTNGQPITNVTITEKQRES